MPPGGCRLNVSDTRLLAKAGILPNGAAGILGAPRLVLPQRKGPQETGYRYVQGSVIYIYMQAKIWRDSQNGNASSWMILTSCD